MKDIKVLGSGCPNCVNTARLIEAVAQEKGVAIALEKVTDIARIMGFGVMSTPWRGRGRQGGPRGRYPIQDRGREVAECVGKAHHAS